CFLGVRQFQYPHLCGIPNAWVNSWTTVWSTASLKSGLGVGGVPVEKSLVCVNRMVRPAKNSPVPVTLFGTEGLMPLVKTDPERSTTSFAPEGTPKPPGERLVALAGRWCCGK